MVEVAAPDACSGYPLSRTKAQMGRVAHLSEEAMMSTHILEKRSSLPLVRLTADTGDVNAIVLIVSLATSPPQSFSAVAARIEAECSAVYVAEIGTQGESDSEFAVRGDLVDELHDLRLRLADAWPSVPLVLVAVGGADTPARHYAELFPGEVQGMVVAQPIAA